MAINNESEWLSCEKPRDFVRFCEGKFNNQRFRWLAIEWGNRIRQVLYPDGLEVLDAYSAWAQGQAEFPQELFERIFYGQMYNHTPGYIIDSDSFVNAIQVNNPMTASAYAGRAASDYYLGEGAPPGYTPPLPPEPIDYSTTHKRKSKRARAQEQEEREIAFARREVQRREWQIRHDEHELQVCCVFCNQFRDVAGNPFRPVTLNPRWQTDNVTRLAQTIDQTGQYHLMPILADALLEADCDSAEVLKHCREETVHVRGCWVIDLLLGRM